jgi:hypothetical protein
LQDVPLGDAKEVEMGYMNELEQYDRQLRLADSTIAELNDIRALILQERAASAANLQMTPGDLLEGLRRHAIQRVFEGKDIRFFDSGLRDVIAAEPYPSKYDGAWRLSSRTGEWYEKADAIVRRINDAEMLDAQV